MRAKQEPDTLNNPEGEGAAPARSVRRLAIELFAASFVVLFQELTLIRWFPGQVRVLAYFPNLILLSAFLGLGLGHNFCLGANLARLEIQIVFEELLRRLPDMELDGRVERLRSNFINGIKRMPVRFQPARS